MGDISIIQVQTREKVPLPCYIVSLERNETVGKDTLTKHNAFDYIL